MLSEANIILVTVWRPFYSKCFGRLSELSCEKIAGVQVKSLYIPEWLWKNGQTINLWKFVEDSWIDSLLGWNNKFLLILDDIRRGSEFLIIKICIHFSGRLSNPWPLQILWAIFPHLKLWNHIFIKNNIFGEFKN